jgi:hypothetical protein
MLIFKPKVSVDWGTTDPTNYRGIIWSILNDRYNDNTLPESLRIRIRETEDSIEIIDLEA